MIKTYCEIMDGQFNRTKGRGGIEIMLKHFRKTSVSGKYLFVNKVCSVQCCQTTRSSGTKIIFKSILSEHQ